MPRVKKKQRQIFTLFPKLPPEIRAVIWDFCLPQHHVVQLQVPDDSGKRTRCYRHAIANLRRLPHVARVCREARLAAIRREAQRPAYTITDPLRPGEPVAREEEATDEQIEQVIDEGVVEEVMEEVPLGAGVLVPFHERRDIIYVTTPPRPHGTELDTLFGTDTAPHLATLLPRGPIRLCVPLVVIQRSPLFLLDMARQGRRHFYLALGREFVIHMPRGKAITRGLFGHGADETTVLVDATDLDLFGAYEVAYNMSRRGGAHGDLRFLIGRSMTGWVDRWEKLRLDALVAVAKERVETAWTGLQKEEPHLQHEMPVPLPVVYFRLCVKCRN